MGTGTRTVDKLKIVPALTATTPAASTPTLVSMKGYGHLTAIISVKNAAGVTGSAITLAQSKTVAGANSKALGLDYMFASTDIANSVALTNTAVTSNTFTTQTVNSKDSLYIIEVDADSLDVANGFDCIAVSTGASNAANLTSAMLFLEPRYPGPTQPSFIAD